MNFSECFVFSYDKLLLLIGLFGAASQAWNVLEGFTFSAIVWPKHPVINSVRKSQDHRYHRSRKIWCKETSE